MTTENQISLKQQEIQYLQYVILDATPYAKTWRVLAYDVNERTWDLEYKLPLMLPLPLLPVHPQSPSTPSFPFFSSSPFPPQTTSMYRRSFRTPA